MSEPHGENGPPPALSRAEQVLNLTQQRIKDLLDTTGHQIQYTAHDLQTKASHVTLHQPATTSHDGSRTSIGSPTSDSATTERAEQLISTLGHYLETWSARAGQQIARTTARLREDVEDLWAEAQHIRLTREPRE